MYWCDNFIAYNLLTWAVWFNVISCLHACECGKEMLFARTS